MAAHTQARRRDEKGFFRSLRFRYGLVLAGILAVAGTLLWAEHATHIMDYLPLILLLGVCGGMHFFMHGKQGGGQKGNRDTYQVSK